MSKPTALIGGGSCDTGCNQLPFNNECFTAPFYVTDNPVVVRAFGLEAGDVLLVEQVAGCNEGEYFEPYLNDCGCQYSVTSEATYLVLPISGRYRLNGCATAPLPQDLYVEMEEIRTGASIVLKETGPANCGSVVTITRNPDGSYTIVIDGVPTTIPAPPTKSPVVTVTDGPTEAIITVDGVATVIDKGPDTGPQIAALLALVSCAGAPVAAGTAIATCVDLNNAIAGIPSGPANLPPSGPAGGALIGTYPAPGLLPNAVAQALAFTDCDGAVIGVGADLATCENLDAAVAAIPPNPTTLPPSGLAGGALIGSYPAPGLLPNAVAQALAFTDCNGAVIGVGADLATCENLDAAIAAIPPLDIDELASLLCGNAIFRQCVRDIIGTGPPAPVAPINPSGGSFSDSGVQGTVMASTHGTFTGTTPISLTASGLPAGVTFTDNANGTYTLTGTYPAPGTYLYNVVATNVAGTSTLAGNRIISTAAPIAPINPPGGPFTDTGVEGTAI